MNNLTNKIKTSLLNNYTFIKGELCCTELWDGFGIADFISVKKNIVTEIEIKISVSDLYNELKKTKEQWGLNNNNNGSCKHITKHTIITNPVYPFPNKYYFCVPTEILPKTLEFAKKLNRKYGVIEFIQTKYIKNSLRVAKKAYMLHTIDNSINYKQRIIDRNNNDLCRRYKLLYWQLYFLYINVYILLYENSEKTFSETYKKN